jgi:YebC/PmpR family DNA-binding regulatory protein
LAQDLVLGIYLLKHMSGHSKWATTHRQKEVADSKRANVFTKMVRNIIIAARAGADPEMNFKLRLAIDKARAANMPKDNIDKAIAKGSGADGGALIEEVIYEGYGPGGSAILIEAATDNRNRTTSEVKNLLSKGGGSLAGQNAVKWMFEHKGVIRIEDAEIKKNKDEFEMELIDLGAEDVLDEGGGLTIYAAFENFPKLKKSLEEQGLILAVAELEWLPKDPVALDPEKAGKVEELVANLEALDDVANVFSNVV